LSLLSEAHLGFARLAKRFKVSPGENREPLALSTTIVPVTNMDDILGIPKIDSLISSESVGTGFISVGVVPVGKRWKFVRCEVIVSSGTLVLDAVRLVDPVTGFACGIASTSDISGSLALDFGNTWWCETGWEFQVNIKTHTAAGIVTLRVIVEEHDTN